MRMRIRIVRENAGDDMEMMVPAPPEVVVKDRVFCGRCSTSHIPTNPYDTHPQCPLCGQLIDLTSHQKPTWEHGPGLKPVA